MFANGIGTGIKVKIRITSAATAKLIQVTCGCSRAILGKNVNTEIAQSSKIVIRNRD